MNIDWPDSQEKGQIDVLPTANQQRQFFHEQAALTMEKEIQIWPEQHISNKSAAALILPQFYYK